VSVVLSSLVGSEGFSWGTSQRRLYCRRKCLRKGDFVPADPRGYVLDSVLIRCDVGDGFHSWSFAIMAAVRPCNKS